jgi:hypothetical protein
MSGKNHDVFAVRLQEDFAVGLLSFIGGGAGTSYWLTKERKYQLMPSATKNSVFLEIVDLGRDRARNKRQATPPDLESKRPPQACQRASVLRTPPASHPHWHRRSPHSSLATTAQKTAAPANFGIA